MSKIHWFLAGMAIAIAVAGSGRPLAAQTPASSPTATATSEPSPGVTASSGSESPIPDISANSANVELQAQVQDALSKVPELSNDNVRVTAGDDGLELSGNVGSGRERQAAFRIAQSFARGKKVVDHIVVGAGNGVPNPTTAEKPKTSRQNNLQP